LQHFHATTTICNHVSHTPASNVMLNNYFTNNNPHIQENCCNWCKPCFLRDADAQCPAYPHFWPMLVAQAALPPAKLLLVPWQPYLGYMPCSNDDLPPVVYSLTSCSHSPVHGRKSLLQGTSCLALSFIRCVQVGCNKHMRMSRSKQVV
jgi:hypothetical protein